MSRHLISRALPAIAASLVVVAAALAAGPGLVRAQGASSVAIVDFAFQPASLEVAVGTTVTWTNQGAAPHTVTADDGSFDSGQLAPGASFSHTFDTSGTVAYHCNIHPSMTASISVTGGAAAPAATQAPAAAPAATQAAPAAGNRAVETPSPARGTTAVPRTGVGPAVGPDRSGALLLAAAFLMLCLSAAAVRRRA